MIVIGRNVENLLQKDKFYGESKNLHLSIFQNMKYRRFKQIILDKATGIKKVIHHYLPM